jgi:hypothetical protein
MNQPLQQRHIKHFDFYEKHNKLDNRCYLKSYIDLNTEIYNEEQK